MRDERVASLVPLGLGDFFECWSSRWSFKHWGRSRVDGPLDHEVTFTPRSVGTYARSASPSFSGRGLSTTATVTVTE